jgi:outer membrane protein TolC
MRAFSLAIVSACACCLVQGEEAPAVSGRLTLSAALSTASRLNETAEIAAARLARAQALQRQAAAFLIPGVNLTASMARVSDSYDPFADSPIGVANNGALVDAPLFNAENWSGAKAAGVATAAQELDSRELNRILAYQVTAAFLQTIAAEQQFNAAQQRRDVAKRVAEETAARAQAGLATPNDATRSNLEVASAELTQTNAGFAARNARRGLATLIGDETKTALADPPRAELPAGEPADLLMLALRQRNDLQAEELRVRADDLLRRKERLGYIPALSARGSYTQEEFTDDPVAAHGPEWRAALVAEWSLFDGGASLAAAQVHDADRRERLARLRFARRELERELNTAIDVLSTSQVALTQAQAQVEVARANLAEVQARFTQGLATGLQQADANAALFEAQSNVIARQLDADQSRFEIRRLIGWWPLGE